MTDGGTHAARGPRSRTTAAAADDGAPRRGGEPELVGDVLRRLMRDVAPRRSVRRRDVVREAWEQAAGPALAEETRPATLRGGVLTVEVRSAALLHELEGFRRDELLARVLDAGVRDVTGLRFRLGVF